MIEKALRDRPGRFDRVVDVPNLDDGLRKRMFTDRLTTFKSGEEIVNQIVSKTDGWNGSECQEFVNTLNLHFIMKKDNKKVVTKEIVDSVIDTMQHYGICNQNKSHGFGLGKKA
jgi:ATP-dependent 26S proteasome regulatory subunit